MKNNSTKILVAILSIVLLVGAFFAMTASAQSETKPEIFSQNVMYTDKFCLMYAIKADTVKGGAVTLHVYDQEPGEDVYPLKSYTVNKVTSAADSGAKYDAYIVTTDGVSALAMDQKFYAQAVDGENNTSEVGVYSVAEYLYTKLADVDGNPNSAKQNEFLESVVAFGAKTQNYFLKEDVLENTTLISDYCYVTTEGCTIDGKTAAVVPQKKVFSVASESGALSSCTLVTYDTYTTLGNATTTEITGNSVIVENSARAHIVAGSAKIYKTGTEGFEGYNVGDMPFDIAGAGSITVPETNAKFSVNSTYMRNDGTVTIASDRVYGKSSKVLKFAFTGTTGDFSFLPTQGDVTREEATKMELSFDMKFDENNTNTGDVSRINFWTSTDGGKQRDGVYIGVNEGKLYFKLVINANKKFETTFNAYEWNNIRFVFEKGVIAGTIVCTNMKIFINNDSSTPDYEVNIENSGNRYNLVEVGNSFMFRHLNTGDGKPVVYFDNAWCGFLND